MSLQMIAEDSLLSSACPCFSDNYATCTKYCRCYGCAHGAYVMEHSSQGCGPDPSILVGSGTGFLEKLLVIGTFF